MREIKEEYGCNGIIQERLPAHSVFGMRNGKKSHWLSIPFFVKVNPDEVKNNEPEKIDEIGWFVIDKLPEPLHPGFKFTFMKYQTYFKKYKLNK